MGLMERLEARQSVSSNNMDWVCFDIETGFANDNHVQKMIEEWRPSGNLKKQETIDAKREEFLALAKSKSSLGDYAQVICLSLEAGTGEKLVLSAMPEVSDASLIDGYSLYQFKNSYEMLSGFAELLREFDDRERFTMAGHNIRDFDLPMVRGWMARMGIRLPRVLMPHSCFIYDTMQNGRYFSSEMSGEKYISFDKLASRLGIESHKGELTGAQIPHMHELALNTSDKIEQERIIREILIYSAIDAQKETKAFLLMSGNN